MSLNQLALHYYALLPEPQSLARKHARTRHSRESQPLWPSTDVPKFEAKPRVPVFFFKRGFIIWFGGGLGRGGWRRVGQGFGKGFGKGWGGVGEGLRRAWISKHRLKDPVNNP